MNCWEKLLTDNNEVLQRIYSKLDEDTQSGIEITPPENLRLRFTNRDLSTVKVLILGQDPYPQSGVATGRAFEVGTLHSWFDNFRNTSLKNIVRAIYAAKNDKKAVSDGINIVVVEEIGKAEIKKITFEEFYKIYG